MTESFVEDNNPSEPANREFTNTDGYSKYCGIGTIYDRQTPAGARIRLMESAIPTPARLFGLRDGDIIYAARELNQPEWQPVYSFQDYANQLQGMEGSVIELKIYRANQNGSDLADELQITMPRANIYPFLPVEGIPHLHEIPYQSEEELLRCVPMSKLGSELNVAEYNGESLTPPVFDRAAASERTKV